MVAGVLVAVVGIGGAIVASALTLPFVALAIFRTVGRDEAAHPILFRQIALLRRLPLFAPLAPPALEAAAASLLVEALPAGTSVITEGDVGDRFYAIEEGEVQVSQGGRVIGRLGPGSSFGEFALIRDIPRTASVVTVTDVALEALDRDAFLLAITASRAPRTRRHGSPQPIGRGTTVTTDCGAMTVTPTMDLLDPPVPSIRHRRSSPAHGRRRPTSTASGDRHDPHPVDRRGPAGELRTPRRPDGRRPDGVRALDAFLRTRPDAPCVAGSRPLRPVGRARSMLLYSLLHLTGYDLPLDELTRFRRGSRTPGHPESGLTPGEVEATTGPLGQGFANAVGMAIAERRLGAEFNGDGGTIVDHRTYVIASDGDLQEGIASEAASSRVTCASAS